MKKRLAVCLMFLVAFNLFFSMANVSATPTTYEDDYYNIIEKSLAIVPDITIHEVGTLKVTISWVTPTLTFERANFEHGSETISYYALKENKDVLFTVANTSIKSTDPGFNGNIKVTPNFTTSKGALANNVTVTMTKENIPIAISDGNTNKEIILKYAINTQFVDGPLSSNLSSAEISSLLTANVTFKIESQ